MYICSSHTLFNYSYCYLYINTVLKGQLTCLSLEHTKEDCFKYSYSNTIWFKCEEIKKA